MRPHAQLGRLEAAALELIEQRIGGFDKPAFSFSFKRYDWPRMLTVIA